MPAQADNEYFPLTPTQRSIWYSEKLYPATSMGNIAATLRILSSVDYDALELSINLFLQKNDAVRIRITEEDGKPFQYVSDYSYQKLNKIDFNDDLTELFKWDEIQTRTPMRIVESDLFQFVLIKVNHQDGGFFVKFHHLISDAWTMSLLGNSVMEYYTALVKGEKIPDGNKPSFLDYVQTDKYRESTRFQKDKIYWEEKFACWQEVTALKNRKTGNASTRARRKTLLIPAKLTAKIHEYCEQKMVSEFSLFFAAISMYINRVTHKEDLVFGTTFLNRSNAKEKETAGMFANVAVPVRVFVNEDLNLNDLVESVSKEIMTVLRHQKYPYDLLLKEVREKKGTKDNLFDIVLTYQNSKFMKKDDFDPYITRWHFTGHQIESLIINLNDRENDGRLIIDYDYLTDMFYATEIEFIHNHVISLLWHALDNPIKKIYKLEMLSEKEKQKILFKFNDTQTEFPSYKTVQQLFEEQAERTPDNIAVVFGDKHLSYRDLNHRSNQLARLLRKKGVKPDSIVGIMLERSFEMIIGIFGILKAGGAYLPIDPKNSLDRTKYMLEDCNASVLLTKTNQRLEDSLSLGVDILDISVDTLFTEDGTNIDSVNKPTDLAYVIYTSGSTGKPKGVMNEHRSLINRINWMQKKYPLNENSVILQKTTYTFDVSVWELMWWSFIGARVCMLEPEGEKDPLVMIKAIQKYNVTTLHFVPSMLSIFLYFLETYTDIHALSSLKQVFASGEALNLKQVQQFNRLLNKVHGTELYNLYGPTEAAIDVTSFDCSPHVHLKTVPIGKPIDNIKLYILDKYLNLLPIGIPGELFIGGIGVARGYINKPELTLEKFIPNPYEPNERLYRTGDLVRWYAEGDIEYLGRIDHQIKLRGFRIELGEIENQLLNHPDIQETVVMGIEDTNKQYLCAYYVSPKDIPSRDLKRFLSLSLPEYMVPAFLVRLEALPLSSNGKTARKDLPLPLFSGNESPSECPPPRNSLDQELLKIMQNVLELEQMGIDDSLFDLGGDSLTVMMIFSQIYNRNWGITAADFYSYPTVRELSDKISGALQEKSPSDTSAIAVIEQRPSAETTGETYPLNHVFLTGATGFLGAHILSELIETTDSVIHCLIRAENESTAKLRLTQTLDFYFGNKYQKWIGERLFPIKGNVSEPNFGLTADKYQHLGTQVDTAIHSAATVKYYGDYAQVEEVNVNGTKEMIDFALRFDIKLNHISTVSVTGNYLVDNNLTCDFTESDLYVGQNILGNIYVRSKFEAENIVLNAVKNGLRATIFRMGNLTGRYVDGHFQPNITENAFYGALKSILDLGVISEELLSEEIELSPVDYSAKAVLQILKTTESDHRIFHIFNNKTIKIKQLFNCFTELGFRIMAMDRQGLDHLLQQMSFDKELNRSLLGMMVYLKETGELAHSASIQLRCEQTIRYLNMLKFKWPELDDLYISRLLDYMFKISFLRIRQDIS